VLGWSGYYKGRNEREKKAIEKAKADAKGRR